MLQKGTPGSLRTLDFLSHNHISDWYFDTMSCARPQKAQPYTAVHAVYRSVHITRVPHSSAEHQVLTLTFTSLHSFSIGKASNSTRRTPVRRVPTRLLPPKWQFSI